MIPVQTQRGPEGRSRFLPRPGGKAVVVHCMWCMDQLPFFQSMGHVISPVVPSGKKCLVNMGEYPAQENPPQPGFRTAFFIEER